MNPLPVAGVLLSAMWLAQWTNATEAQPPTADDIELRIDTIARQLDPRVATTLESIDGTDRRLLALRGYLRSAARLASLWSWDNAQRDRFNRSPARAELDAAVGRVSCVFAHQNPGHALFVNMQLRTLELQVERWNQNDSVARAGANLLGSVRRALSAPGFPPPDSEAGHHRLRELLVGWAPSPTPTLAAPGLSAHGRLQAVDFQVQRQGKILAGPSTATVRSAWDEAGWTLKLKTAVETAAIGFQGPLLAPYEPWHYDFKPASGLDIAATVAADVPEQCRSPSY